MKPIFPLSGPTVHVSPLRSLLPWLLGGVLACLIGCTRPPPPAEADAGAGLRLGAVEFSTSGRAAAQPHFLRGLAALHSFWYAEAIAEFTAALRLDPDFAMGWWGIAMAHKRPFTGDTDDAAGRRALEQIAAGAALTQRELGYIGALRAWHSDGTPASRAAAYATAMRALAEAYPDDREAALFHALSLLGQEWPEEGRAARHETAARIATEVYQHTPRHPGAAHYLIHSYDDPELAHRGLDVARHYSEFAPNVPHALHMPSHIYVQLGMWSETARANEAAWAASEDWVRRRQISPALRDYHNLHWLIYACLQQGRYTRAAELLESFRAMRNEIPPANLYFLFQAVAAFVIETRKWDRADALFAATPGERAPTASAGFGTRGPVELCSGAAGTQPADISGFIRAFAAAARGAPEADRLLDELYAAAGGNEMPEFWQIRVRQIAAVSNAREQAFAAAIKTLRVATAIEEELGRPPGPPAAYKPPHELLGEVLLRAGQPVEAAEEFRKNLDRHPNRALSLLGLARAEAAGGNRVGATRTYTRLLEVWRDADEDLEELREARAFVRAAAS